MRRLRFTAETFGHGVTYVEVLIPRRRDEALFHDADKRVCLALILPLAAYRLRMKMTAMLSA